MHWVGFRSALPVTSRILDCGMFFSGALVDPSCLDKQTAGTGRLLTTPSLFTLFTPTLSLKNVLSYFVQSISVPIVSSTVHVLSGSSVQVFSKHKWETYIKFLELYYILSFFSHFLR